MIRIQTKMGYAGKKWYYTMASEQIKKAIGRFKMGQLDLADDKHDHKLKLLMKK